jgi:sterol desaturase/sphingolipid hydroxylase (fatty acid hydroxylase superfamily)
MKINSTLHQVWIGGLGVSTIAGASILFDQTPGTIGLFESLSYSSQSLFGVQWWGFPFFELVFGLMTVAGIVEVVFRLVRRETGKARRLCEVLVSQVGYIGVWIFVFSAIANVRNGDGLPRLLMLRPEQSWFGMLALLVLVDALYYWEHRTRLSVRFLGRFEGGPQSVRSRSFLVGDLRLSVFSPIWTMVFLGPLAILGFDLLWLVVMRMLITLYKALIDLSWLPRLPWMGWLFMGRSSPQEFDCLEVEKDLGGMLRVWDRLFNTASTKGQR